MKRYRFQVVLLLVVASFFLSPLFWTTFGCGGSTVAQTTGTTTTKETGPTVDITGTVSVPTTTASSLVSALGVVKNATTDSAASGLTCTGYTLEGDDLGDATTAADGTFTLAAVVDSLKPTDATTTGWTARFYIQCTDADGRYDIRNYCEASVTEGTTTSIGCSADPDTTLTTFDLLSKSGCTIGASCTLEGIDPLCFMEVQKKAYKDSSTASGTGVQDDLGSVKEIMRLCMAATTPAALGVASPEAMISAAQGGTLTSTQLDLCGASSTQKEKYAAGATAVTHLRDIFYSNIAGGSGVSAALALEMKGISQAETGSACDLAKSDSTYAANLVATYGSAKDTSELETMKKTANLDKTILATMAQYCPSNKCDLAKFNPGVLVGTLSGCGMDPKTCGFTDADGKLQAVFDEMKLTIDGTDKAGVGTDFDKLRSLGASWGNTFKTQGITTAVTGEASANRMAQLFGSTIGTQGTAYDATKAGETFTTYQTKITGSGGTTLDTCLASATTDEARVACYATTATPTLTENGGVCTADSACRSGYCGGTTGTRVCKALGSGVGGDVCSASAECSSGTCTSGFCASGNLPGSFSFTTGSLTSNTCAWSPMSWSTTYTITNQTNASFSSSGTSGSKSGNTFTLTEAPMSISSSGCNYNQVTSLTGRISSFGCTAYTFTLTVSSGNCLSTIGSNTPGATCVQTFGSASCTVP